LLVDKLLLQQKEECSPAEVSNSMAFFNSPNSMLCRQVGRTIIAIDMSQQKLNTFNIHVIQMNSLITELEKCREIRSFLVRSHQTQSPPAVVQITVRNMLKHLGSCSSSPPPGLICCSLSVSLGILAVLLPF
jgi:hypothetical protein